MSDRTEMVPVKCPRCRRSSDVKRQDLGKQSGMITCPLCGSTFRIHGHKLAEKFDRKAENKTSKKGNDG